jgi:DeoR/GlpR family transcriptional regulator of sugar metabolism
MPLQRRNTILELLERSGSVSLNELGEIFPDISVMTLRRDLIQLENEGIVIRTMGGAVKTNKPNTPSGEESAYPTRESEQKEAKETIAKKALAFVETGRSIYMDAGSTIMSLATQVPDETYSMITSGINIAQMLLNKEKPSVVVLGGFANRNTLSMSGPLTAHILDSLNIDIAFISASGFSIDSNFTVANIYEAELKTKVLTKAKKVIVLMDTSKINKSLPYTFASIRDIDILITETKLSKDLIEHFKKNGVTLL